MLARQGGNGMISCDPVEIKQWFVLLILLILLIRSRNIRTTEVVLLGGWPITEIVLVLERVGEADLRAVELIIIAQSPCSHLMILTIVASYKLLLFHVRLAVGISGEYLLLLIVMVGCGWGRRIELVSLVE